MLVLIGNVIYVINVKKKKRMSSFWSPIVANVETVPGEAPGVVPRNDKAEGERSSRRRDERQKEEKQESFLMRHPASYTEKCIFGASRSFYTSFSTTYFTPSNTSSKMPTEGFAVKLSPSLYTPVRNNKESQPLSLAP